MVSLASARKKRDQAREMVEPGQHHTREKKVRKLRQAVDGQNTFEKIAVRWIDLKQKSLNHKYRAQCLTRIKQNVFAAICALAINEITIPDVARVVENIGNRGNIETAKRMKQLIAQVFRYALQTGLCKHNPAADLRDILPAVRDRHHASIHPSDLPVLLKAMQSYQGNAFTKAAMQLLALTFVRTGELMGGKVG